MTVKLRCPECREPFGSAVALDFHGKEHHPVSPAVRSAVLAAYRSRDRARAGAREAAADQKLDHLYSLGCPCGRSLAWHRAQRAALTPSPPTGIAGSSPARGPAREGEESDRR